MGQKPYSPLLALPRAYSRLRLVRLPPKSGIRSQKSYTFLSAGTKKATYVAFLAASEEIPLLALTRAYSRWLLDANLV